MLSQKHRIFFPLHQGPHRATATTIGTNSLGEIGIPTQDSGQANWNHRPLQIAPQPQEPDASETIVVGTCVEGMKLTPFHAEIKQFHQAISALASTFKETWWSSDATVMEASMRLRINALPGLTTLEACCNFPMRERRSLLVPDLLGASGLPGRIQDSRVRTRSASFSPGRRS